MKAYLINKKTLRIGKKYYIFAKKLIIEETQEPLKDKNSYCQLEVLKNNPEVAKIAYERLSMSNNFMTI